ncbi:MAG: AAA family ATPase [Methanobrevibacter sp.]|jgi:dephospho-CoA kinase|nr:AAA family ATPase [Candidatus Methanoflexus mossambicus]
MRIIGISGLPGSGKSYVSEIAIKKGAKIVNMGDCVREEAKKRKLAIGVTAIKLREEEGEFVVAKLTIKKLKAIEKSIKENIKENIEKEDTTLYIIEGIRSPYEVEMFKNSFDDFYILSIFASPKTRFKRLKLRNREDDNSEHELFYERDQRELKFGIGTVIALSDYLIINENSLEEYEKEIEKFFSTI